MTTTTPESRLSTLALHGGTPVSSSFLSPVSVRVEEDEIAAVTDVLRSGMLAQGKVVAAFEEAFAEATGARHAIACSNGTTALQLAYHVLLPQDATALVPAWTFIATASMVRTRPAVPVFVDVDRETFCMSVDEAAARRREDTKVIVPVHLYGLPVDIDRVQSFADEHDLRVVYDAAQSHLATYGGRPVGAFGDMVTYSFYPTKNMTTGEGGMITTNDDALAEALRVARDHGAKERYLHESLGFNYRMTDIAAAMGLAQLERLPGLTERRQANAAQLTARLETVDGVEPPVVPEGRGHVFHQYTCRLDMGAFTCDRATLLDALKAEGCGWALHYPRPLHRQPVFADDPAVDTRPCPVSDELTETIVCLPVHAHLGEKEMGLVADAVEKIVAVYRR